MVNVTILYIYLLKSARHHLTPTSDAERYAPFFPKKKNSGKRRNIEASLGYVQVETHVGRSISKN